MFVHSDTVFIKYEGHLLSKFKLTLANLLPSYDSFSFKRKEKVVHSGVTPHLSEQLEHFSGLLQLLFPEKPLYFPDPRHPPRVGAMVPFPQHPRQLVGLKHQGGEQEVPSASARAPLTVRGHVIPLTSPLGQFGVEIQTSVSGQLGAHHSGVRGRVAAAKERVSTTYSQNITLNL